MFALQTASLRGLWKRTTSAMLVVNCRIGVNSEWSVVSNCHLLGFYSPFTTDNSRLT